MASAEEYKLFAEASIVDQAAAKYFGIAIGGLIGLFTAAHWTQRVSTRLLQRSNSFRQALATASRPFRKLGKGTVFGFTPGRALLALVYFAINIVITFTNVNWTMQTLFAKRLGWMTLCNLCLVVLLGLKNTPLSPLAGRSYESVNVLHRCCGYTTILYMLLHSTIYVSGLQKSNAIFLVMDRKQYAAATAGLSMLVILFSAVGFIRKRQYEVFVTLHQILVAVILAMVGFHVYAPPDISTKTVIIIGLAAGLWMADRSLRLSRWIYCGVGNYCTLTPLPEGATRVVMHRHIRGAPGSHAFLWIPGIHIFQTHPFTLVSSEPAEFIVAARDGFTKALYEAALAKPGCRMRASVEGPYGQLPDVREHDKVVLIAGGSGATFTIALGRHWARQIRLRKHRSTLDFVWAVKSRDCIRWFEDEITELRENPAVTVRIHITGGKGVVKEESLSPLPLRTMLPAHVSDEGRLGTTAWPLSPALSAPSSEASSVSRNARPNVDSIIGEAASSTPNTKKVLVAAAGPRGLLANVRVAVATRIAADMPSIQLHLEEFGW